MKRNQILQWCKLWLWYYNDPHGLLSLAVVSCDHHYLLRELVTIVLVCLAGIGFENGIPMWPTILDSFPGGTAARRALQYQQGEDISSVGYKFDLV